MKNYKFKAITEDGKNISDTAFAENPYKLYKNLIKSGLKLEDYKLVKNIKHRVFKINYKTLSIFSSQLSELLESSVPLDKALYIISKNSKDKILSNILDSAKNNIISGESLSYSLGVYKEFFPEMFINLISFGEKTCSLNKVLSELSIHYDKKYKNLQKIKTILVYPICVLLLSLCVLSYLLIAVVPKFNSIIGELSGENPDGLIFLMNISNFVSKYKFTILLIILSPLIFVIFLKRNDLNFENLVNTGLKVGFIRNIYKKFYTKSFLQDLNTILSAGVKIQTGIEIIKDCTRNLMIKEKLNRCVYKLQSGEKFTRSLEEIDLLNEDSITLLKISESSGDIEGVISKMISFSQRELDEYIKRAISLIEPAVILLLSFLVGAIVVSVFLPMLSVMDKII